MISAEQIIEKVGFSSLSALSIAEAACYAGKCRPFGFKQILKGNEVVGCVTVEPFMLGDFVKLTNNTGKKDGSFQATDYGLAFGHFTYLLSAFQEVVVDLQGVSRPKVPPVRRLSAVSEILFFQ